VLPRHFYFCVSLALLAAFPSWGQSDTGVLRVWTIDEAGKKVSGAVVTVQGTPAAHRFDVRSGMDGSFELILPYGRYRFGSSAKEIDVAPLQTTCANSSVRGS
jgi:hypothetical protein